LQGKQLIACALAEIFALSVGGIRWELKEDKGGWEVLERPNFFLMVLEIRVDRSLRSKSNPVAVKNWYAFAGVITKLI
jgi:hypothetical protein